jgi:hypothetical protein
MPWLQLLRERKERVNCYGRKSQWLALVGDHQVAA